MNSAHVDFVYVNYNSYEDVIHSVASLGRLVHEAGIVASVSIVDNSFIEASPDSVVRISSFCKSNSTPNFFISYQPCDSNIGFGAACSNDPGKGC